MKKFNWIGDGFQLGSDQVGRRVELEGKHGTVVAGTAWTITVKFDSLWSRLVLYLGG